MTGGSPDLLVLGVGNILLGDDGAGPALAEKLSADARWSGRAEFVDGGTQGLALLPYLSGRRAVLVLDAVALGAAPGTVHVIRDWRAFSARRAATAHEGNALELLAAATLIGECPETVAIVGIEPEQMRTGIGLSAAVQRGVAEAVAPASGVLAEWLGV